MIPCRCKAREFPLLDHGHLRIHIEPADNQIHVFIQIDRVAQFLCDLRRLLHIVRKVDQEKRCAVDIVTGLELEIPPSGHGRQNAIANLPVDLHDQLRDVRFAVANQVVIDFELICRRRIAEQADHRRRRQARIDECLSGAGAALVLVVLTEQTSDQRTSLGSNVMVGLMKILSC